jgi:hypothetical protein
MALAFGETAHFRFCFAALSSAFERKPDPLGPGVQRGFVVGLRFVLLVFAVALFAAAFFFAVFLFAAGFVTFAPEVARLECFARARGVFFGAASAGELSANEATSATRSAVSVLRIIIPPAVQLR